MTTDQLAALITPILVIVAATIQQWQGRKSSAKLLEVKQDTHEVKSAITEVKDQTQAIHALSNKSMGVALQVAATALRKLAEKTGTADYDQQATKAELDLKNHLDAQARLDVALAENAKALTDSKPEVKPWP